MSDARATDDACGLCGHFCRARRTEGERGRCTAGERAEISAAHLHHGEEPPISGPDPAQGGSGTIFFTRCNLRCVFCQNWQIAQSLPDPSGRTADIPRRECSPEELAEIMLWLRTQGALNINLVSPTPHVRRLVPALRLAKSQGMDLPVVYNSGGYDSLEALRLMDGLVDIYLPDAKLAPLREEIAEDADPLAARLLGAEDYVRVNRLALREMFRQVGHLEPAGPGPARRGLLVRHLVMPEDLARTSRLIPWLAENFGPQLRLNLMAQYRPMHLARSRPEDFRDLPALLRPLRPEEYEKAAENTLACGLTQAFIQGPRRHTIPCSPGFS
ncbi:MAG: radical SAM protein [Deltaproteobacteria bacterium]|nr:radical SAM protein [Deltaproteobacteria bacterium]